MRFKRILAGILTAVCLCVTLSVYAETVRGDLTARFAGKPTMELDGETLTLRGRVTPVGGIKEKILAAKRAGIKEIILSDENRKNIEEIQDIYLKGLTFHYVKDIKEVFAIALTDEKVADAIDLSVKKEKTEKKEE